MSGRRSSSDDGRSAGMPGSRQLVDASCRAESDTGCVPAARRSGSPARRSAARARESPPAPAGIATGLARARASTRRRPCAANRRCAACSRSSSPVCCEISSWRSSARKSDVARRHARHDRQHDAAATLLGRVDRACAASVCRRTRPKRSICHDGAQRALVERVVRIGAGRQRRRADRLMRLRLALRL